jgi:hypothetical protein
MLSDRKGGVLFIGNPLQELDKSDPLRTHFSDCAGYMITAEFPMSSPGGYRSEFIA